MVHVSPEDASLSVKQVEFNTIASSFGGLSTQVSKLHQHLRSIDAYPESLSPLINRDSLPEPTSISGLALGLAKAHQAYEAERKDTSLPLCVIFLVQDTERNVFDQRHLEYALNRNHSVRVFRLPFSRVLTDTTVDSSTRKLLYTPPSSSGQIATEHST
jgi:glutathione synthase